MSISIEMSSQEFAALKQLTRRENDGEAIAHAAREFLRLSRPRELKGASGKVDFDSNWQELEALELKECSLPHKG